VIKTEGDTPPKQWWKSKTLWFNAFCAGLIAAEANLGMLKSLVPASVYPMLAFGIPIGNAWLRIITTQGLTFGVNK
jgi:hypothetical protein